MPKNEREFHRKVAVACFNGAWDYLGKKRRTSSDDREMLSLAHASRYHWGVVGTPTNRAVSDWQVSRAYAEIGDPRLSLEFAKSSLAICESNGLGDTVHTANEACARAYAVAGEQDKARAHLARARRQLNALNLGKEDREVYLGQINETERLIGKK